MHKVISTFIALLLLTLSVISCLSPSSHQVSVNYKSISMDVYSSKYSRVDDDDSITEMEQIILSEVNIEQIIELFDDPDPVVRAAMGFTTSIMFHTEAYDYFVDNDIISILINMTTDAEPLVRMEACYALESITRKRQWLYSENIDSGIGGAEINEVEFALIRSTVSDLISDDDASVSTAAARFFYFVEILTDEEKEALILGTKDEDFFLRIASSLSLVQSDREELIIPVLIEGTKYNPGIDYLEYHTKEKEFLLHNIDRESVIALGQIGNSSDEVLEAIDTLATSSSDAVTQLAAIESYTMLENLEIKYLPILIQILNSPFAHYRVQSISLIGSFGVSANMAIPLLEEMLDPDNEPSADVRNAAQEAIESIRPGTLMQDNQ